MLRKAYLNAMQGLEAGLKVRDIAVFGLTVCWPDETIQMVRERVATFDFDNVPVRGRPDSGNGDGPIVGVVEQVKNFAADALVQDCMRTLREPMLISGSVSLVEFLPRIAERPYRLVLEGERVIGVVTPSDVVQLPVRLLVFTLLVHLEETMRSLIRWKVGDEAAREALSPPRRRRLDQTLAKQRESGLNPLPLDATQFADKASLLFDLGVLENNPDDRELFEEFYALRNAVDHARDYAQDTDGLRDFLRHVALLQTWIERLTEMFPPDLLAAPES